MTSLRARLLRVLGLTIVLCWVGALTVMLTCGTDHSSEWDSKLQAMATKLLMAIPSERILHKGGADARERGPGLRLRTDALPDAGKLSLQVWIDRQKLLVNSPGSPLEPLQPEFRDGAASTTAGGQQWRVYSVSDSTGRIHVQVANLQSVVDAEMRQETFVFLGINTVVLALVGALMWLALNRSLRPVLAVEAAVRTRRRLDLTPLPVSPLPTELQPLVESFNHLLRQLDHAVESERRFIGDAAHELRTPLSALQAQAQVALRAATLPEKDAALRKLLAVVDRSTRLSEQLLDLARLQAGERAPHQSLADLSELIVHVAREFDVQAEQQDRAIGLNITPCEIACDVDEIGILLRNLIDNALRYTLPGGRLRVSCGEQQTLGDRHVFLEVADDGPGVPESERQAIFTRFHRVAGSNARGSGIGLSLVAGITQLHQGRIETGSGLDGRGLAVRIRFPAPAHTAVSSAVEVSLAPSSSTLSPATRAQAAGRARVPETS